MKLLSAVLLSALSLPAVPALAVEASPSPLLGRWSLDITTSALPEAQRPKQVVLEFKDAGAGRSFWAAPMPDNSGFYKLFWNADNNALNGSVPVAVKRLPPPSLPASE